jgi:hypothetical protein
MTIGLDRIIGEQLSSVEIVQDYVQLHFDGPTITAFVWPTINSGGNTMRFGDLGYRDELCGRIAHNVTAARIVKMVCLTVQFDDGVELNISLKSEDSTGPEAGHFRLSNDPKSPLLDF